MQISHVSEDDETLFYPLGLRGLVTKGLYSTQIYPNKVFRSFNSFTGLAHFKNGQNWNFKIFDV